MLRLLASLALAAPITADYIQTSFYLANARCSGAVFQTLAQLPGCTVQGANSLTVSCLNDTAAVANVYSNRECSGPSSTIEVPFDSSCSASGSQSSLSQCKTGPYTPSKGINIGFYPGPPNACPVPEGAEPDHLQDISTGVCLQASSSTWLKFGCNAVNVTLSYWNAKGCAGAPYAVSPALPLGCSATPADPAKPNPSAGPRVAVCGKKQQQQEEGAALGAPLPLPMADARAAVAAALAEAAAAAVARALAL